MPRVLFNTSEVHEVQQRCGRRINRVVKFAALLICQSDCLDETGCAFKVLLKKHRRVDAARPALQDRGPIFQKRQYVWTDFEVVAQQFKLGDFFVGPINALETGYWHQLSCDIQDAISFRLLEFEEFSNRDRRALLLRSTFYCGLLSCTC